MKVVILAGGFGTRIAEANGPKPMVNIGNKPILYHIINYYKKFGYNDFIVALGYKGDFIKKKFKKYNIKTIYTGINSDIILRLEKISKYSNNNFLVCYGDTMLDINLNKYIKFYLKNKKKILVASYQLKSSFGILDIKKNNDVINFKEKPILNIWFNIGYFIFSFDKFHYFKKFNQFQKLLTFLSKNKLMKAYKHTGKHITINTVSELEIAKQQINKFN